MSKTVLGPFDIEKVFTAVSKVKERARRVGAVLEAAGIPYAVIGGNAVASWVSRVDEAAERFTKDVDVLLRRSDLDAATRALSAAGFVYRHSAGMTMFLDGPQSKARDAVHVLFAGEKVTPNDLSAAPDVHESEAGNDYRVISLEALVRMKLTSFRRKDQVHVEDMLDVGLIDETWCQRFPGELGQRLRHVIDTAGESFPTPDE